MVVHWHETGEEFAWRAKLSKAVKHQDRALCGNGEPVERLKTTRTIGNVSCSACIEVIKDLNPYMRSK